MKRYPNTKRVLIALDCIVFGFDGEELKVLLIKRNFSPEKGKWSLMGGFLGPTEDMNDAANRIILNLTGLHDVYFEELKTFSDVNRDSIERTISVCHFALINIDAHDVDVAEARHAKWFALNEIPALIFDHQEMVDLAIKKLRYKAALHPIGFELLPPKFTLPHLQKLYEAIFDCSFDRRNFSRKLLSTKLLIDTGEKNKGNATKKAKLYSLDVKKYQKQFNSFHHFISDFKA